MGGETVTVQFWLNQDTDVLVELARPRGLMAFDLDGTTTVEARSAVFSVLNAALSLSTTLAVVADSDLADYGDDVLVTAKRGALKGGLSFTPALLATADGGGRYTVEISPESWLALPTCIDPTVNINRKWPPFG
jgi:hypothetical protein